MDPLKSENAGTTDTKMETDFTMQDVEQHTEVDKTEVHGGFNVWHTLTVLNEMACPAWDIWICIIYVFRVFEAFYRFKYLINSSQSSILWISSFQLIKPFLLGLFLGKVFDDNHWALDIRVLGVQAVAHAAGPVLPQPPLPEAQDSMALKVAIINDITAVIISILYGMFSSAWLSLCFACCALLAHGPEEVGARVGLALALISVGHSSLP
ncbi:hypothetical protein B0H10DRAFT_1950416 [Mycena sp. CBHHK59/15]|nr:hypothetical protein B0H10DRAFT_1950416 [Mycena sp. CBHHK59/15]